jgi:DNA-binding transcriptional regulator LsrR (DeoR family)
VRVAAEDERAVIGIAAGEAKLEAIRAALKGRLINGLITDERTATGLLA